VNGCRRALALALAAGVGPACADLLGIEEREDPSTASGSGGSSSASTSASTSAVGATTTGSTSGETVGPGTGGADQGGGGPGGAEEGGGGGRIECPDDLTDDPDHCGSCFHTCLGGDCEEGVCQAVQISPPLAGAEYRSLVADPGAGGELAFARWRPSATVFKVSKTPGSEPEPMAMPADGGWASDVKMDHEWIYFSNYSDTDSSDVRGVHAVRRVGGQPVQLVRDDTSGPYGGTAFLLVDGEDVFFTTLFGSVAAGRTGFGGQAVTPLWFLGPDPPYYEASATPFAADHEWIYDGSFRQGVLRHRRDGGETQHIYADDEPTRMVGVEGGYVYWRRSDGVLCRAPVDGRGPIETIDGLQGLSNGLVGHGHVFGLLGNRVLRVSLDDRDGAAEVVIENAAIGAAHFTIDDVSVYLMSESTGAIYRRAL
jgi:hypothetical protein